MWIKKGIPERQELAGIRSRERFRARDANYILYKYFQPRPTFGPQAIPPFRFARGAEDSCALIYLRGLR